MKHIEIIILDRFMSADLWLVLFVKMRRCGIIAYETTIYRRPKYTEINNYRSQYGRQQWTKPIPHSQL